MKVTEVFLQNLKAHKSGYRYIINQGSARSSKTYSLLQLMEYIQRNERGQLISIVAQTLPHLRRGAIRDFLNIMTTNQLFIPENWSKGNLTYTFNDTIIEFFSVDQPDKVYGAARDYLFCNEINSINEEAFRQLAVRTRKQIFTDYNPTHDFYITEDYKNRPNAKYIHSTFLSNDHLEEEIKKELLEAGKRNPNFQKVFVEGEVGEIEGTVFNNWEIGEFDKDLQFAYGQDYGFSSDPTTLIKIAIDKKNRIIYAHECFYLKGLSTNQIYRLNNQHANNSLIVGDSAEPRLIKELKELGNNIMPCEKGQGSVSAGLLAMQDYKIILTPTSHNLHKEFRNYVWLDSGSKLVIDDFNHGIDSIRYIFQILMKGKRTTDPQKIADMFY
jgi:phage terminase large subunit